MKYTQPPGAAENASYVGRNVAAGQSTGSKLAPQAVEHPQREIVAAIARAGLTPSAGDLTQLGQASKILAQQALDRIQIPSVLPTTDITFRPGASLGAATFTRGSVGTCFDALGALQSAANNVPRYTFDPATGVSRGLLIEASFTNYLLNSAAPATQTVTLAAGTYCLGIVGTGSATLSGGATGVATQGSPVSFSLASSGSVVVTVAGSVTRFQLENGHYATSFIATTTAAVTRLGDLFSETASWWNPVEGAFYLSFYFDGAAFGARIFTMSDGTVTNSLDLMRIGSTSLGLNLTLAGATVFDSTPSVALTAGVNRMVVSYGPAETYLALNGILISAAPASPSLAALTTFKFARANNGQQPNVGILRRAYFPRALSQEIAKRMTLA